MRDIIDIIKHGVTQHQLKDAGFAFCLISSICGVYIDVRFHIVTIVLLLISMTVSKLLYPVAVFWHVLAHFLGEIVSRLIIFIVYSVIIVPMGTIVRIFKKDPLLRGAFKKETRSVFVSRNHKFEKQDILYPY